MKKHYHVILIESSAILNRFVEFRTPVSHKYMNDGAVSMALKRATEKLNYPVKQCKMPVRKKTGGR
ncbi:MAG: hypothetical protein JW814_10135 [Candidatus Krumholzibacteriota bacterium]|nr:hypothetical protein [Candidatus Krumholzibacteriota bacterium]